MLPLLKRNTPKLVATVSKNSIKLKQKRKLWNINQQFNKRNYTNLFMVKV